MASVYRKREKWWVHYRDATGRWRDVPTKVDTKTAAKQLARELEHKAERQRLGLEPNSPKKVVNFGDVMTLWWEENEPRLRSTTIGAFADKHLRRPLGNKLLGDITPGDLESLFNSLLTKLKPKSINNLRGHIAALFNFAARRHLWNGRSPLLDVRKLRVPKRHYETLKTEEIATVLKHTPAAYRAMFATAIYTGLRKGELLALQKEDVDLGAGTIVVRRSHSFDRTKGDHDDQIPIAAELKPYLEGAIKASKSQLMFPRPDGTQHPRDVALHKILRGAAGRAGLVTGYRHICRRCRFTEDRDDKGESRCPRCGMTLWVSPKPKQIRFHDLRHTTATLLMRAKVPLQVVQRVLRHSDPGITANIYGKVNLEEMQEAVDTLGKKPLRLVPATGKNEP